MASDRRISIIAAPREGVNDDVVRVVQWLVRDGEQVGERTPVVTLETTKATFDVEAGSAGFVFRMAEEGAEVPVGAPLAVVAPSPDRPVLDAPKPDAPRLAEGAPMITEKARKLIERHGLDPAEFAGLAVVRSEHVEEHVRAKGLAGGKAAGRRFAGEELDPDADWDEILRGEFYGQLKQTFTALRRRMKAKHGRHVSANNHLYDRWELARDYGFGEGTSVYDDCMILGDVRIGRHCWVGPFTILDGGHAPLTIGDYVDIGAGCHIYTHNSIERALTGHKAGLSTKPTTIGSCCFLAPMAIIAPGAVIGDRCFVAAGSYVEGVFEAGSFIAGNPARRVGDVVVEGDRARIIPSRDAGRDRPGRGR
jgi:acetyltransferase-like isoleucine patch superfamily enzyme